jgi:branched-subunit amino acid transport protein
MVQQEVGVCDVTLAVYCILSVVSLSASKQMALPKWLLKTITFVSVSVIVMLAIHQVFVNWKAHLSIKNFLSNLYVRP